MFKRPTIVLQLFVTLSISASVSCTKATSSEANQPTTPTPEKAMMATQAKSAQKTEPAGANWFRDVKGISLTGLKDEALEQFFKITNEEVCPCPCASTFAQCISSTEICPSALPLAEWLRDMLVEGFPADQLSEVITQEVVAFSGETKDIDVKGYATKGSESPEFTIVEYADFQCPHCKELGRVLDEMVHQNKQQIKVIFKHYPLAFHEMAEPAAIAVEAAGHQGKFWEMHDIVYKTQDILDQSTLRGHAKVLGLDMKRFDADIKSPALKARVTESKKSGEALGIEGTPAVYINGRSFNLLREPASIQARFAMERSRGKQQCAALQNNTKK